MLAMLKHYIRVMEHFIYERVKGRTPYWRQCRKDFLERYPTCAACGGKAHLGAHHIEPFEFSPSLEIDWTNLITLCMGHLECQLHIGCGGDYLFYNPHVVKDAKTVLESPSMRREIEQKARAARVCPDPFA
jgi:hypothetical protein